MTVGHLFNAGLGRTESSSSWFRGQWVWLPLATACLSMAGGLLNLIGVEYQCTHIFVPTVFGFQAFLMGLQGALFGEFSQLTTGQTICWSFGMMGTIVGTVLVSREDSSERREKRCEGVAQKVSSTDAEPVELPHKVSNID